MQILASALPGFRDLRAPVLAGYIWLLFAWAIVQPDLGHQPQDSLGAALYDLGRDVGHIWIAAAVGVAAYLVGSISQAFSDLLQRFGQVLFAESFGHRQEEHIGPVLFRGEQQLQSALGRRSTSPAAIGRLEVELRERSRAAANEAARELDLPAILLVGDQSELFAEVDRLRAEGELRLAVTPPLFALGVLLSVEVSYWWLMTLPAMALLFIQGMRRIGDSKASIAEAIRIGRIPSASTAKFEAWVDNTLQAELARAEGGKAAADA